ncbi:MAG: ABC transporter ATP-binding protein/permease [Lachnospiraceae bacterium]|nr:ABC transporter ATP-binding protein/permease [Lachnospiraceae bacterium]
MSGNLPSNDLSTPKRMLTVIRVLFGTAAKKYPLFFLIQGLKTLLVSLQPFIGILLSPLIVDEIVGARDVRKLTMYAGALIIGEFIAGICIDRCGTYLSKHQERLSAYFDILIGKHSMELDFQLTEDKEALEQLEKARTGMSWYSGGVYGVAEQVFAFFGNVFSIAGFITVIAAHAPLLLLVMAGYCLINFLFVSKNNRISLEAFQKLSKENRLFGYFSWHVVDPRFGKDIRLYDAKKMLLDSWEKNTDKTNANWKWQADKTFPFNMGLDLTSLVRSIFAYFYVALLAIRGFYGVGTFSQLIAAESALDRTLGSLAGNITELIKRCNYAYEYVLFMNYPAALPKGEASIAKRPHEIEFRHVSFAYPKTERKILDDISITIKAGEHLSIVGLNGAGKTTFIKLLCRLYDPTEGQILMDGIDIREYDYNAYMEQFAPVFQDFKLFAFSLEENITVKAKEPGASGESRDEKIPQLINLVGLQEMVSKLERGTDTNLFKFFDEQGVEPSGGEQQKIAIARALYKDSPIVILDEPTAALDPMAEYEIYRQFHTLVGGKSAIYISHRLSSCRFCDRIAVFSEGKVAEYGTHDELVNLPQGIYAEMFEAQAKYYR